MHSKISVVITTINQGTKILDDYYTRARRGEFNLVVVGDKKTPSVTSESGVLALDVKMQSRMYQEYSKIAPYNHYSRKNFGYIAARDSAYIFDTDDDNYLLATLPEMAQDCNVGIKSRNRFINIYNAFSDYNIWPRGLPLDQIHGDLIKYESLHSKIGIQQYLANGEADVDAIFRLINPGHKSSFMNGDFVISKNNFVPFNSQATYWRKELFLLMYLPSFCSFRMTDIWRSFVAQKLLIDTEYNLLFSGPIVFQDRNEHNIMLDFHDETTGYLHNSEIVNKLLELNISGGEDNFHDDIILCYELMVNHGYIKHDEIPLLKSWLREMTNE